VRCVIKSGRLDLNLRPLGPKCTLILPIQAHKPLALVYVTSRDRHLQAVANERKELRENAVFCYSGR
jgi:hypothetical protein